MNNDEAYAEWVKTTTEKIAETNRRIRTAGGTLFFDLGKGLWMITVVDAAPIPAYKHSEEFMRFHKIGMEKIKRGQA